MRAFEGALARASTKAQGRFSEIYFCKVLTILVQPGRCVPLSYRGSRGRADACWLIFRSRKSDDVNTSVYGCMLIVTG
eukprot:5376925-Prymnesium_polylepis.1